MKHTLACCLIFLATMVTSGQSLVPSVGFTYTSVSDQHVVEGSSRSKYKPGFTLGLTFKEFGDRTRFTFVPGIHWVQRGFRTDEKAGDAAFSFLEESVHVRINYIEAPMEVRWRPAGGGFYFMGGAYVGYALSGKYSYDFYQKDKGTTSRKSINDAKLDFKSRIPGYNNEEYAVTKRGDWGMQLGLGSASSRKLHFQLKYAFGFAQLNPADESKPKNRAVLVVVGVPISL